MSVWLVLRTFSPSGSEIIPRMCSCSASFDAVFPLFCPQLVLGASWFCFHPTQHSGFDDRCDIFSLGIVAHQLFTGDVPYKVAYAGGKSYGPVDYKATRANMETRDASAVGCNGSTVLSCFLPIQSWQEKTIENGTAWEIVVNCHELSHLSHPRFLNPFIILLPKLFGECGTWNDRDATAHHSCEGCSGPHSSAERVAWCPGFRSSDAAAGSGEATEQSGRGAGRRAWMGPNPMAPYGSSVFISFPYPMISWPFRGISMYFRDFHGMSVSPCVSLSFLIFLEPTWTMIRDVPLGLLRSAWNTHGWWNAASDGASADCGQRVAPLWEVLPCCLAIDD